MTPIAWPTLAGAAAAVLTTLAFVPQLFRMRRRGDTELSALMLGMYVAGQGLWLAYGVMIGAMPLIVANAVSLVLVGAVAAKKSAATRAAARDRRRLRIAIDMDEVMADALGKLLRRYSETFGTTVTPAQLQGHHLEEWVEPAQRAAVEAMYDASFFAELEVMPGCQDVVRELARRHEVLIVTAAMDVPCSFDAKFQWLQRHFPFIPPSQIVFCGDKGIVDADFLIDDRARHFDRFKGKPLLFSAPHNAAETRYPRVGSWEEVRQVFARFNEPAPSPRRVVAEAR